MSQESERDLIVSGVEAMMARDHEKSLELLIRAKNLAEQNNNKEDLFLAFNNIGANYYSMLDYGEALSNYLEAYNIAINHLQPNHEMSVLNNIAILYSKENNFAGSERYFKKAYLLSKKTKEPKKQAIYAINLGNVCQESGQLILAEKFFNEAVKLLVENPKRQIEAQVGLIKNLELQKETNSAKKKALEILVKLEGIEFRDHRVLILLLLSSIYNDEGNIDQAIYYSNEAIKEDINLEDKIKIYNQLAFLHGESGNYNEALLFKDKVIETTNKLNIVKNGRLYETNRVKFEIQNYQQELVHQQDKINSQKQRFNILLYGSIIIVIMISWALRNSFVRSKQKKILHKKAEELINLELEKEKTEKLLLEKQLIEKETLSLLQQEKLKNEIDFKNRKLSAKALYLSDRNNLINSIIEDLDRIYHVRRDPELKSHIQNLKGLLKTDKEWESFIKHFEEVNHGFINRLKTEYSLLNTNDIRFLSYIYMNLSVKEISFIFNITPEACRKRKERVSKKLGLTHGSYLYDYLYQMN